MVVRGVGDPIDVREPLRLEEAEYVPARDQVEHVVARDSDGPVEETTVSLERFAHRQCVNAAADAVLSTIEEVLDPPIESIGTIVDRDGAGESSERAVVLYPVRVNPDEEIVKGSPVVGFDELVTVTPRRVRASAEFEGREFSCELPVFVRATEAGLL